MVKKFMGKTVAETIRELSRLHIKKNKGLIMGQCLSAVGWVQNTVPAQKKGIVEFPMTDVAGAGFVQHEGVRQPRGRVAAGDVAVAVLAGHEDVRQPRGRVAADEVAGAGLAQHGGHRQPRGRVAADDVAVAGLV